MNDQPPEIQPEFDFDSDVPDVLECWSRLSALRDSGQHLDAADALDDIATAIRYVGWRTAYVAGFFTKAATDTRERGRYRPPVAGWNEVRILMDLLGREPKPVKAKRRRTAKEGSVDPVET